MKGLTLKRLARIIAKRLGTFRSVKRTSEEDYERVFKKVARRVPLLQAEYERNQARARDRYRDLVDQPPGRQSTVLENAQPPMLLAMAHDLMKRSYAHRFGDVGRSLKLAQLAHRVAEMVARSGYVAPSTASDLLGEVLCYLGNARRINSDVPGAESAFAEAEKWLHEGTRDRHLRALLTAFLASLRYTQGHAAASAALYDKEIALRRLLKEPTQLGAALINRGLMAFYSDEPLARACAFIREGVELVEDARAMYLGLLNLADAFAREGDGAQAWKLLCMCHLIGGLSKLEANFDRRRQWVEGIAYRALGEADRAEETLTAARDEFSRSGQRLLAAFAALDLLPVLASQGKRGDVIALSQVAHREFLSLRLEQPALSALLVLQRAAIAEQLSEELAIRVANFVVRHHNDGSARFEPSGD